MLTALKLWTNCPSAFKKQHTLQSNVNCAVTSSAIPKVTQSRNFNCTNLRIFQHTLDLTAQLLTVQLKLKVKLNLCGGPYISCPQIWSVIRSCDRISSGSSRLVLNESSWFCNSKRDASSYSFSVYDCAVQNTYTFYNLVRHIRRCFDRLNILHLPASIPKALSTTLLPLLRR